MERKPFGTYVVTVTVVALIGLIVAAYFVLARNRITSESFESMQLNMSLAEVEAIWGPGEPYETSRKFVDEALAANRELPAEFVGAPITAYQWRGGRNQAVLFFAGPNAERLIGKVGSFP